MKKYYISEVCILANIGTLLLTTNALLFSRTTEKPTPKTVCSDNQDADTFIKGNSHNAVQNFMDVISAKGLFNLIGDMSATLKGCRKAISDNKYRKQRLFYNMPWTMDCWEPTECTMIEQRINNFDFLYLLPVSTLTNAAVKVLTVLLPLDFHDTSSYTFLPSTTQKNMFFVTAVLSGCSVFVAKPNDIKCNLIVIHTNHGGNDTSETGTDYNHLQAMAVLEQVQSTSHLCRYQIEWRWATAYWRPAIEAAKYDYADRIFYYDDLETSFLYGRYLSRNMRRWLFCIKTLSPNPPPPTCSLI